MRFTDWLFLAKPEFNYKRRKELEDLRDSRSKRLKKYNYNFEHENNRNRI